ncbi:RNA-directed DNA polymerase [Macrococcus equipercicus]|uniref:RNA-directed DNA polymerase n=1 Tax=Macrococcus equipercicus TaxID=69967 RepID=A0ABQ6R6G5_9STAP|nr:retron Ec67 family RNA-directed DNA polymerase/endonuclease [Macrococcus equipercicus]KAA1036887.1 RNA-directed DNA polymerase [Macrococcus equipercicus]
MENLSLINTKRTLAFHLSIPYKSFVYLLYHLDHPYSTFEILKKNGESRVINSPHPKLKRLQYKIKDLLETQYNLMMKDRVSHNVSHGFIKERSIFTNAKIHRNKKIVFNIDIKDFFKSIHFGRVRGFLIKNKYFLLNDEVATTISKLICYEGSLPQGAPTSPIMSNLILNIFDMKVLDICQKYSVDYTRYADDLTFSSNSRKFYQSFGDFYYEIEQLINKNGFKLNGSKYRVQLNNSRQEVTGLVVNNRLNIKRDYYKATRSLVHKFLLDQSPIINEQVLNANQIEGRLSFIHSIEIYNKKIEYNKERQEKSYRKDFTTYLHDSVLNAKEREYQKFLFYNLFYKPNNIVVFPEGKTDIYYIKAALKKYYKEYPELVEFKDNKYHYKINFIKRNKRLYYFFDLAIDGADTMSKILNYYSSKPGGKHNKNPINYFQYFNERLDIQPSKPVVLLFDNEGKDKPLHKFINTAKKQLDIDSDMLKSKLNTCDPSPVNLIGNLYILTINKLEADKEYEIEDMIKEYTDNLVINGRKYLNKGEGNSISKIVLAQNVLENYETINLENIKPLLNKLKILKNLY